MIEFKSIVRQTQKFLSTMFQNITVDEETERLSKNRRFLSIIKSARAQKGKGLSSQEMRRWVETELSEKSHLWGNGERDRFWDWWMRER